MSFTLTDMTAYAAQHPEIDIAPIILDGDSFQYLSVQEDIKSSANLIMVSDTDVTVQGGDYSAAAAAGGVTIKPKVIQVTERFIKETYKPQQLNAFVTQLALAKGSNPEDFPAIYASAIRALKGKAVAYKNELSIWQGDTASADANLKLSDGLVKLAAAEADVIKTGSAAVALTEANAVAEVKKFTAKVLTEAPELITEENTLFMSPAGFQMYYSALSDTLKATQSIKDDRGVVTSVRVPGTSTTAKATSGLTGSNAMILAMPKNLYVGTDLISEDDKMEFKYLEEAMTHRLFGAWKLGAQIGDASKVIINAVEA